MNGLTRYIFWQLLMGLVLVTVSLACVVWLSQSLRFVDMIINRGLSVGAFVTLTGLMIPNFLTAILPISLFAVITFTYHRMIMDRELMVMRAAGQGPLQLAKPAILLALIVVVIGYALSTYLVPASYAKFRDMQWNIRYSFSHVLLREGTFNEAARGITVYVRQRTDNGELLGILAHDGRDKKRSYTLMSERGVIINGKDGARVIMFNGSRQDFDKKTKKLSILYFDRYVFKLDPQKTSSKTRFREARERSMAELLNLDTSGMNSNAIGKFHMELRNRLIQPWTALGFAIIALSVFMSGSFSRRGEGHRVVLAIVLATLYQGSLLAIINVGAKNETLIPVFYIISASPFILAGVSALPFPKRFRRSRRTGSRKAPMKGKSS